MASFAGFAWPSPAGAAATTVGPIDFESYDVGNINGQDGWSKTGAYDVEVATVADFGAADDYGFQTKALRGSNFFADGAFGGQAFSPGVASPAAEGAVPYFTAGFKIGTTSAVWQPGLVMSVSPDDGNGGRMSYLRFNDTAEGVDVVFVDVTGAGPVGTAATFNPDVPIATLDHGAAYAIKFEIAFVDGPGVGGVGNDVVKIYVDGVLKHTGTTWENYYRFDGEQAGNGNVIPSTSKLLFAARGDSNLNATVQGDGFLFDRVRLSSSTTAPVVAPPNGPATVYDGNKACADLAPAGVTWEELKIDGVPDDGTHDDPDSDLVVTITNSNAQTFNWDSNMDISAVLVKGGDGGTLFSYPGVADLADTGLHALAQDDPAQGFKDISNVSFCFRAGGDTPPPGEETPPPMTVTPPTPAPQDTQPVAVQPAAVQPAPVQPATAGPNAEVLGEQLIQGGTLPVTGTSTTRSLALAGALGLVLGLAALALSHRRTAVEST